MNARWWFAAVPLTITNRRLIARLAAGIFFPQRPLLKLDTHGYSTAILHKILTVAAETKGFDKASAVLQVVGEFYVSGRHINELADEIGEQMQQHRDRATDDYVHHRREPVPDVPQAAAVVVDGGRLMTREPGHGSGVHQQPWKEDKVACVLHLSGPTFPADPHPHPPECFLDAPYVDQMVRDIQAHTGKREEGELPLLQEWGLGSGSPDSAENPATARTAEPIAWPPKRTNRTCVATMQPSHAFGKTVAAEAYRRGVFAAERKAFLGDGSAWIWTLHRKWFSDLVAIADFVHPLTYLYVTATVLASSVNERWQWYVSWMTQCWQGGCAEVITDLERRLEALGPYPQGGPPPPTDPRAVLGKTIGDLQKNRPRMGYPESRCQGLPVTSSAVESLIKEVNYRVKGTEKFWNRPEGAERMLQLRAAVLSDDNRLATHLTNRPGSAFRRYRKKETRKAG